MRMQEELAQVANQPRGLERGDESSVSAVFPGHLSWLVRPPDPQSFLGSSVLSTEVTIPIALLQVLAVCVRSTDLDHLEIDVPVPYIDLSHGSSIPVLDLRFQGYGLALDQPLKGVGGPPAT